MVRDGACVGDCGDKISRSLKTPLGQILYWARRYQREHAKLNWPGFFQISALAQKINQLVRKASRPVWFPELALFDSRFCSVFVRFCSVKRRKSCRQTARVAAWFQFVFKCKIMYVATIFLSLLIRLSRQLIFELDTSRYHKSFGCTKAVVAGLWKVHLEREFWNKELRGRCPRRSQQIKVTASPFSWDKCLENKVYQFRKFRLERLFGSSNWKVLEMNTADRLKRSSCFFFRLERFEWISSFRLHARPSHQFQALEDFGDHGQAPDVQCEEMEQVLSVRNLSKRLYNPYCTEYSNRTNPIFGVNGKQFLPQPSKLRIFSGSALI